MVKLFASALLPARLLLLALAVALACGPLCRTPGDGPPEETAWGREMMGLVPLECSAGGCVFLDMAAMRDHFPALYAGYRDWYRLLDDYGVDFDAVDRLASAGLSLFLAEGRFDPERVREELGMRDYVRTGYLGVGVWQGRAAGAADWVALVGGMMVAGCRDSVIDCLEVIIEGEGSICAHSDVGGIIDRLPGGLDMSVAAMDLDNPLLAHGESLQRIDDGALKLTVVRKYVGPAAAEEGARDIAGDTQDLLPGALRDVRVQQEGQFVTLTARVAPAAIAAGVAG